MSFDSEKKSEPSAESIVKGQPVPDDFILLTEENRKGQERKLVRKLDLRLMPTVVVIYLINYIDRIAITAARLKGLETDLHLTDVQYYTLLAALYASYCPAQIPSNMILGYISRPSLYIGACVVAWGLTSAMTGVTKDFGGIMACRLFIGLPEAAFYPGAMYLLSRWYTKKELALRSAVFYVGLLISNAFGSVNIILRARFSQRLIYSSVNSGWNSGKHARKAGNSRLEMALLHRGAVTILFGLLTMWLLPDFPHNTRWMSPAERHLAQVRLAEDAGEADQDSSDTTIFEGFNLAIRDPKVWIFMLMSCSQLLGLSFINFFPTLTATLGYNTTVTLLMAAPPWVFASICCVINAWNCGKKQQSDYADLNVLQIELGALLPPRKLVVGHHPWIHHLLGHHVDWRKIFVAVHDDHWLLWYVSILEILYNPECAIDYIGFALTLTWVSNAIPRPPAKRSAAIGLVNGFGNLGNLMGSYIWKASWSPEYHQSMIIAICGLVLSTFLGLLMRQILIRENKQMDRLDLELLEGPERDRIQEAARLEGVTFEEAMRRRKGFRYLY
ncbi:major facilitator superfamily domain-containing protein [Melanogaster broomeanus]|nr:major facilitator superfamily domain-containing protein [Melanogaster broomeanus]